jgi:hypothetical protein
MPCICHVQILSPTLSLADVNAELMRLEKKIYNKYNLHIYIYNIFMCIYVHSINIHFIYIYLCMCRSKLAAFPVLNTNI